MKCSDCHLSDGGTNRITAIKPTFPGRDWQSAESSPKVKKIWQMTPRAKTLAVVKFKDSDVFLSGSDRKLAGYWVRAGGWLPARL